MSKHYIQPEYGKKAGWCGTGRPNPSRETKFSGANGDREVFIFPIQLTTSRIGSLNQLIHTLLHVMAIHTYTLPIGRRRRASSPQGSSSNGCCLFRSHCVPIFVRLSFPTPTICTVGMCDTENIGRGLI